MPISSRSRDRDNKNRADRIDAAHKEVQFDHTVVREALTREERFGKNTPLRRESQRPTNLGTVPADGFLTSNLDGDGTSEPNLIADDDFLNTFREQVADVLPDARLKITEDDLDTDLEEKLQKYSDHYAASASGPAFLFKPFLEVNQGMLDFDGLLDLESFKKLYDHDADALFIEMKMRALLLYAYHQQGKELYRTAQRLDLLLGKTYDWAQVMAERIQELVEENADMEAELDDAKKGKDTGGTGISPAELKKAVDEARAAAVQEFADQLADRDERLKNLQQAVMTLSSHGNRASPAVTVASSGSNATATTTTTMGGSRSAKHESAPIFYNDKDKDIVPFDVWYRRIKDKLEINADHFPTERSKMVHVEGRMGGNAATSLEPYLRESHPDQLTTVDAMLDHLWKQYHDYHREEISIDEFNALEMKPGDNFNVFKNKFVRLAGESRKPKQEWKHEFKRKVLPSIANLATAAYIDASKNFEAYAQYCSEIALNFQQNAKRRNNGNKTDNQGEAGSTPKGRRGARGRGNGGAGERNNPTSANLPPRPSAELAAKLIAEGKCLICQEKGHISRHCHKKEAAAKAEANNTARVQAIVDDVWGKKPGDGEVTKPAREQSTSNKEKLNAPSDDESENE